MTEVRSKSFDVSGVSNDEVGDALSTASIEDLEVGLTAYSNIKIGRYIDDKLDVVGRHGKCKVCMKSYLPTYSMFLQMFRR